MIYRDLTEEQVVELVAEAVSKALTEKKPADPAGRTVPVGISMRHVHLDRRDMMRLFGPGYTLTPIKTLSQPGQYAAKECVDVIGPKGTLKSVRILGPLRRQSQVELAQTDCRTIGVKAPVRMSGDLEGTPGITLRGPCGEIMLPKGLIVAKRHIHLSPTEAEEYGLKDGDVVRVGVDGVRPGVIGGVVIRSDSGCSKDFHVDTDEGNAFMLNQGQTVRILGKEG